MTPERIEITTLPNGLRVVSETVPHVQSVSVGLWVGAGSRDEPASVRGISHFIEHMLFKGTERRSPRDIASEIESRGGSMNAFTDKEFTCFYARTLADDVGVAIDVLADMLRHSSLDPDELARERNVVLEEIKRYRDTPEELIHDVFTETLWRTHPLGRSVIGSARTVGALDREAVAAHLSAHYTPDRIVLAAAGNVPHERLVELAMRHLGDMEGGRRRPARRAARESGLQRRMRRRTEQVHFCLGGPAVDHESEQRYALSVLDTALGGTMSSRLFQEIREKRGLAYSIGTYTAAFREGGVIVVNGGTSPETFDAVMDLTRAELEKVREEGLSEQEVADSKQQLRGGLLLGLESMSNRMMRMGRSMLALGRIPSVDHILARFGAVTGAEVRMIAAEVFREDRLTLAAIGPFARGDEGGSSV
ncbi:MAG TPA: pitrilysin family protein [Chthonomonadales bacterium]|nr:pitrilysin family protein [Chthonomonadales bacterium]